MTRPLPYKHPWKAPRPFPVEPLLAAAGITITALQKAMSLSGPQLKVVRVFGLTLEQADRWAHLLGVFPEQVWENWWTAEVTWEEMDRAVHRALRAERGRRARLLVWARRWAAAHPLEMS